MKPEDLRAWRKWMRWSQQDAAEALGLSRSSIQFYESGRQPIPKPVELACCTLEKGIREYQGPAAAGAK